MTKYHKIQSIYKRDGRGRILLGEWSTPEIGYLADCEWEWTEKVDGTNIRIGLTEQGEYRIGGRTEAVQDVARLLVALDDLGLRESLPLVTGAPVCLYGEGYGAKIQKGGGKYRPDQGFVLFDVRIGEFWLRREGVEDVANRLGLGVVPVVGRGTLADAEEFVRDGFTSEWGGFIAEGVVCRPAVQLFDRQGKRIVVKLKTRDYRHAKEAT